MTVRELIEKLQAMDPNGIVFVYDPWETKIIDIDSAVAVKDDPIKEFSFNKGFDIIDVCLFDSRGAI